MTDTQQKAPSGQPSSSNAEEHWRPVETVRPRWSFLFCPGYLVEAARAQLGDIRYSALLDWPRRDAGTRMYGSEAAKVARSIRLWCAPILALLLLFVAIQWFRPRTGKHWLIALIGWLLISWVVDRILRALDDDSAGESIVVSFYTIRLTPLAVVAILAWKVLVNRPVLGGLFVVIAADLILRARIISCVVHTGAIPEVERNLVFCLVLFPVIIAGAYAGSLESFVAIDMVWLFALVHAVLVLKILPWLVTSVVAPIQFWLARRRTWHSLYRLPCFYFDALEFPPLGWGAAVRRLAIDADPLRRHRSARHRLVLFLAHDAYKFISEGARRRLAAQPVMATLEAIIRERDWARYAGGNLPLIITPSEIPECLRDTLDNLSRATRKGVHGLRRNALTRVAEAVRAHRRAPERKNGSPLYPADVYALLNALEEALEDEIEELTRAELLHPQVASPYLAGMSITPQHAGLFRGREVFFDRLAAATPGQPLIIVGQRRIGKTSFVNMLPARLSPEIVCVKVDLQQLGGTDFARVPSGFVVHTVAKMLDVDEMATLGNWRQNLDVLRELERSHLRDQRLLIAIDEAENLNVGIQNSWCVEGFEFLNFVRAAAAELRRTTLVVFVARSLEVLGPEWSRRLVSAKTDSLTILSMSEARDLLVRPTSDFENIYNGRCVDRVLYYSGGHPYVVQAFGDYLCRVLNEEGIDVATEEMAEAAAAWILEQNVFASLWSDLDEEEQRTLRAVAAETQPAGTGPIAARLVAEGFLVRDESGFRFSVPLFSVYVQTRYPSQ